MPARPAMAVTGSCRASVAAGDSSRSEAKTAVGATSTASARSHQLRSSAGSLTASVLTPPRVASRRGAGRSCAPLRGGHVHAVAPPFIISKEQIDTVVGVLDESIGVVEKQLGY